MKVCGVDASLTSTGIAATIYGELDNAVSTRAVNSNKKGTNRLIEIREEVFKSVFGADLVVIEDYSYASGNQAHQIGELGGVLRVMFSENELRVLKVSPSQLKKFITGKGNAKKEEIAVSIFKRWGRDFKTNDEADAFVLVQIGIMYLLYDMPIGEMKHDYALTSFQAEVIDALHGKSEVKRKVKKK